MQHTGACTFCQAVPTRVLITVFWGGGIYSRTAAAMQKEDKIRKDDFASDVGSDTAGSETCGCIQMNTDHPI